MIYLVGFMGSGKTTVGRRLALKLGVPFIDLDHEIERQRGAKISEIFRVAGEEAFRLLETQALEELILGGREAVVATGGGLPMNPYNRELMKASGTIVHLAANFETIRQRLAGDTSRPLWNEEALDLYDSRLTAYAEADYAVQTDEREIGEIVEEVAGLRQLKPVAVLTKPRPYPIYIGQGIFDSFKLYLKRHLRVEGLFVLADENVYATHIARIEGALSNTQHHLMPVPAGEGSKSFEFLEHVLGAMLSARINRNWAVVAVGGGVTGDLAGFAASVFMRGIPVIQVPTTLLAQVDSAIGGKTAVNHELGKNLVGAFHQPTFVLSDIDFLKTLPAEQTGGAMAEVVKYGVIMDPELFDYLEQGEPFDYARIVRSCSRDKAAVVAADEHEGGLRRILNFGHTIGHAVEKASGFKVNHGVAVAQGMRFAAWLSEDLALLEPMECQRIAGLIAQLGIVPSDCALPSVEEVAAALALDKKGFAKGIHFVLTEKLGTAITMELTSHRILEAYERFVHGA
ncbi:MAG: 3-dehydroquinate synthase [Deltaproteobacteria bacterium ADurb.Bin510]|nr:MAG: 3-dehydroquinate synthase [Deltaproteobacteria bacterium ADurb.Bin510]